MRYPSSTYEKKLTRAGHLVIGVDEAGCGSLAGPVIAAAIQLPPGIKIVGIADSKLLSPEKRGAIFGEFLRQNITFSVGIAGHEEVDRLNVRQANLLAMKRAVLGIPRATFALVDAWKIPGISIEQKGIIHGDRTVRCIAAASIVAKVVRDFLMTEISQKFPLYEFARHKGYGTALHRSLIQKYGPCRVHRRTFLKKLALRA